MTKNQLTVALITDTLHGEGGYEKALWEGSSEVALEHNVKLLTFAVGFIEPDGAGNYKTNKSLLLSQSPEIDAYIFNTTIVCKDIDAAATELLFRSYAPRPVVSIATDIPGVSFIGVDNEKGMKSMVTHLVDVLKANRVAYISGPLSNPEAAARYKAYREVVSRNGKPIDESLIVEGEWTTVSGAKCIDHFIKNGTEFDAVACANDQMAIGAMGELFRRGKPVPNDVYVSGFDDIFEASFSSPKLSTVFQPVPELGRQGMIHLIDILTGKSGVKKVLVPAEVVLRSSAPASASESSAESSAQGSENRRQTSVEEFFQHVREAVGKVSLEWVGRLFSDLERAYFNKSFFPEKELVQLIHNATMDQLRLVETAIKSAWSILDSISVEPVAYQSICELLRALDKVMQEHRVALFFGQIRDSQNLVGSLVNTNRALNAVTSLDNLEAAISATFPRAGIQNCYVVLYDSVEKERARIIASIHPSNEVRSNASRESFPTKELLPHGLESEKISKAIVVPIVFEGQELGYAMYAIGKTETYVYETLTDQIASVIHNLLLIERIARDEANAAEKAAHIRELVLPMIRTIQESGALAKDQSVAMENLLQANTQTSQQLSVSEKLVKGMQEYLEKVIELTGSIDELSETINVISINAAIAAAKGGSEGKVFTVIATEIRNLSIQTKTNTASIAGFLKNLDESAEGFFQANNKTRTVFSKLQSDIQALSLSLFSIQGAMNDLTDKAMGVLNTMEGAK